METKAEKKLSEEGRNFHFYVDGHHIHSYASSLTGKEIVYFDGEVVSKRRSFKRHSQIEFNLGGDKYEIEYNVINMLTGELHCTVIKNDVHVETQISKSNDIKKFNSKEFWKGFVIWFLIGAISGFLGMRLLINVLGL